MDKSLLNSNLKRNGEFTHLTPSGLLIMTSNSEKLNSEVSLMMLEIFDYVEL